VRGKDPGGELGAVGRKDVARKRVAVIAIRCLISAQDLSDIAGSPNHVFAGDLDRELQCIVLGVATRIAAQREHAVAERKRGRVVEPPIAQRYPDVPQEGGAGLLSVSGVSSGKVASGTHGRQDQIRIFRPKGRIHCPQARVLRIGQGRMA
jgi:hypothetical protein